MSGKAPPPPPPGKLPILQVSPPPRISLECPRKQHFLNPPLSLERDVFFAPPAPSTRLSTTHTCSVNGLIDTRRLFWRRVGLCITTVPGTRPNFVLGQLGVQCGTVILITGQCHDALRALASHKHFVPHCTARHSEVRLWAPEPARPRFESLSAVPYKLCVLNMSLHLPVPQLPYL